MELTRRRFIQASLVMLASPSASPAESQPYSDIEVTDRWITRWMDSLGASVTVLHLGRFADRMYFLRKEISWTPNPGEKAPSVTVPVGFVTDFASIPQAFWSTGLAPDGDYTFPAILHDYLYWNQSVSRDEADDVLLFAMKEFRVPDVTRKLVYAGVRAGGGFAWSGNAKLKASGEKRQLKRLPTDPHIRWKEWKAQPDVFV